MDKKDIDENALIGAIYDAALRPELWQPVLRNIREWTGAKQCNLIFYDTGNPGRNKIYFGGHYSAEIEDVYYRDLIHADFENSKKWFENASDGMFVERSYQETKESDKKLKKFLIEDLGDGPTIGTRLFNVKRMSAFFAVMRSLGDKGFCAEINAHLSRLAPRMCRAMRIHHQLKVTKVECEKLQKVLQRTAAGVVLLDANSNIVFCNAEATRILEESSALSVGRSGKLQAAMAGDNQELQVLLAEAVAFSDASYDLKRKNLSIPLRHLQRSHPLRLSVVPVRSAAAPNGAAVTNIKCAVFISDPERKWNISSDYLQQAYAMTAAECAISQALVDSKNSSEIAEQRGTTEETARWQIKKILQKTETHSQAELSRLLIALNSDFSIPVA